MSSTAIIRVTSSSGTTPHGVVRLLERRYLLVLVTVALLIVLDQLVIQPLLVRLDAYAPAINLAGRQRMLSQKVAKAALALEVAALASDQELRRAELESSLEEWMSAHEQLGGNDTQPGIISRYGSDVAQSWSEMEPHFTRMQVAATGLLTRLDAADIDNRSKAQRLISAVMDEEAAYLPAMNRVVGRLESEAGSAVARLRLAALSIAATLLGLLLALGVGVVRPATKLIRAQVDELELRVAQRTSDLKTTNESLAREIEEHRQAEEQKRDLARQLSHAARVATMGHLTTGIAHELNQPLTALAVYAEACDLLLAQDDCEPAALRKHFEQLKQAALRSGQIVRRMRNFVRPQPELRARVELPELIREVATLCEPEFKRHSAQLTLQVDALCETVEVDAIQIQQLLVNLLQNALDASELLPAGERSIVVSARTVGAAIEVAVRDQGSGLTAGMFEQLFTPFQTTKRQGLGLGLAICRTIVEQHGGTIWADANITPGTLICFTLPIAFTHDAAESRSADCICRR